MGAKDPRSYLYVPGDRADLLVKAAERGSDALILDLEDGIDRKAHAQARSQVLAFRATRPEQALRLWVRLGPEDVEDPSALLAGGVRRFVFPKAEVERLRAFMACVDGATPAGGVAADIELLALVESARGVGELDHLAAHRSIRRLGFGEADLAADLGVSASVRHEALEALRLQVVVASRAHGLPAPVGPTSLAIEDTDAVEASTRRLAERGFGARTCIHPRQIAAVHAGLAPTVQELASAEQVLAALDAGLAAGRATVRSVDGELVDEAVARRARAVVARAAPD